ncbi:MAG: hypothetical protein NTZ34_06060 [Chloroflexi bacterium]|nr:hypothetical protein [Chloroflexota bacterium]
MEYTKKLEEVRGKRRGPEDVKLRNIVDMALGFSAMMRLFEKGSKETIKSKVLELLPELFAAKSEGKFKKIHTDFCQWGVEKITRTEKEKDGMIVKESGPASYGQMGKTLDVALHVIIYYAHYPDCETAKILAMWLNAAMDTKMMAFLAGCYPDALDKWPKSIEQVGEKEYRVIQDHVRRFIKEEHQGGILPVQFDDVYWEVMNRGP